MRTSRSKTICGLVLAACIMALTGCAKTNEWDKVEGSLKKQGYSVIGRGDNPIARTLMDVTVEDPATGKSENFAGSFTILNDATRKTCMHVIPKDQSSLIGARMILPLNDDAKATLKAVLSSVRESTVTFLISSIDAYQKDKTRVAESADVHMEVDETRGWMFGMKAPVLRVEIRR